jgi:hypothetical protein
LNEFWDFYHVTNVGAGSPKATLGALPYTKVMFPTVETSVGAVLCFYEEALVLVLRKNLVSEF